MLNAKKYALTKIEYLLVSNEFANELFVTKPLQVCFRDHMGYLARSLKANLKAEKALLLCQLHGLVVGSVAKVNGLNSTKCARLQIRSCVCVCVCVCVFFFLKLVGSFFGPCFYCTI